MSSPDSQPISPARFATALRDLPISSLHLKVLELRNGIMHLDYSNEQLRPYADGTAVPIDGTTDGSRESGSTASAGAGNGDGGGGQGDPVCAEAIRENETAIERMQERIRLVRAEVEARGLSWAEFEDKDPKAEEEGPSTTRRDAAAVAAAETSSQAQPVVNGVNGHGPSTNDASATMADTRPQPRLPADVFQTGVIRNGELRFDQERATVTAQQSTTTTSRFLSDTEIARMLEERVGRLSPRDDGDEEGVHL